MSTTRTELDPKLSHGDTDEVVFHYVDKSKIVESAVLGNMVTALCGAQFPVTRQPRPGSPVCGTCKEMYEALKALSS